MNRNSSDFVVKITAKWPDGHEQSGTGFLISADGRVATCRHIVRRVGTNDVAEEITVNRLPFIDGWKYNIQTEVPNEDFAVLIGRVPPSSRTSYASIHKSASPQSQQSIWVWGYSSPHMVAPQSIPCTVSGRSEKNGRITLIGSINSGDSGGPVVDATNKVIGVVQARDPSRDGHAIAIPISVLEIISGHRSITNLLQSHFLRGFATIVISASTTAALLLSGLPSIMGKEGSRDPEGRQGLPGIPGSQGVPGQQGIPGNPGLNCFSPVGAVVAFAGIEDTIPADWHICDGSELLQGEFHELFRTIGTRYGGTGERTFKIPDYRGYFLRGLDQDGRIDLDRPQASRIVGSIQLDAVGPHKHLVTVKGQNPPHDYTDWTVTHWGNPNNENDQAAGGGRGYRTAQDMPKRTVPPPLGLTLTGESDSNSEHGSETRPKNRAVNWIIRIR